MLCGRALFYIQYLHSEGLSGVVVVVMYQLQKAIFVPYGLAVKLGNYTAKLYSKIIVHNIH